MKEQYRQHLYELRQNHVKRLRVLELQAASFGISAPPHILIEIEDIQCKIKVIDEQLTELKRSTQNSAWNLTSKNSTVQLSDSIQQSASKPVIHYPEVPRPINLGFEGAVSKGLPDGWFNSAGFVDDVSTTYKISIVERPDNGTGTCVVFQNLLATKEEFGSLMQRCPAQFLAGRVVKFEGELRTKNVEQWAGLWLRADGIHQPTLYFDNMHKYQLHGTNSWKKYSIDAPLPKETAWLNYGIVLSGKGTIWADNFRLLVWQDDKWQDI